jgi:cytochrome c553
MKLIKHTSLILLMVFISNINKSFAQSNMQISTLNDLGEALMIIAQSDNPDKVLDFVADDVDIDKKAQILESFLNIKENIFSNTDPKQLKLFNVLKQDKNTLFIIKNGQRYFIIKSQTNDANQLKSHFSIIKNGIDKTLALGEKVYKIRCYSCHGKNASGTIGPNLTDKYWIHVNSAQDLYDVIVNGRKGTMMIPYKDYLTPEELKAVTEYIIALQGKKNKKAKKSQGELKDIQFKLF